MKKFLVLFSALFCFGNIMFGKSRTMAEATQLAGQFMSQSVIDFKKTHSIVNKTLTLSYTSMSTGAKASGKVFYYVFNKGDDNGYVIISGDDRAKTILGYTDDGHFDLSVLPTNVKYWLSFYENELRSLPDDSLQTGINSTSTVLKVQNLQSANLTALAPLLGNIKWNQNSPYNNQCPIINTSTGEKAVTGCIATAMAQVMKYYNWPVQGTDSNSYTTTTLKLPLKVVFSKTQYDWGDIMDTYSGSSTATQNDAVATLMYHCGVAVSMDYGQSSSASSRNMALALIKNFGYDSNLQHYYRDYYTRAEVINLLNTELNSLRPVLFSGQADDGGHQFVCDGYDSNGLYHFNWGWGGMSNGYFEISSLDPSNQGIGSSTGGYNSSQTIVTGVQKPSIASTPVYLIYTNQPPTCTTTSAIRTGSFTTTWYGIFNSGVNTFGGNVGLALYDNNGIVQVISSASVSSLGSGYGWSTLNMPLTIPPGIADGNYKLYFVYKASTETNWQIVRGKVGTANYLNIIVDASSVTINVPVASSANLSLNSLNLSGNLYQNKTGRFNVSVTNSGNEYNSKLGIKLQSISNNTIYQLVTTEPINITNGETRTLDFTGNITLDPGQYYVTVVYDPANYYTSGTIFSQLGSALTANVLATPTGTPSLTLSSIISFPNSASVNKNDANLSAKIKNTGGFFDNNLIAFIFPSGGGTSLTNLGYQDAIFDTNEEKTVTFRGPIDLTPAQYQIGVYYWNASLSTPAWTRLTPSGYSLIPFTLIDISTELNQLTNFGFEIYPNPVESVLHLKTELSSKRIAITDLLGKQVQSFIPELSNEIAIPVENLKSGIYLINVQTDSGIKVGKFIKK